MPPIRANGSAGHDQRRFVEALKVRYSSTKMISKVNGTTTFSCRRALKEFELARRNRVTRRQLHFVGDHALHIEHRAAQIRPRMST